MIVRKPVVLHSRELQTLWRDGVATGLTDHELLQRFAECRDDSGQLAFATLIARHGPMVMNVCRRMLRNAADADDAFQATFLVLVRRAGAVRVGTSLAPWLYGVSVRVARRAREQSSRRQILALDAQSAQTIPERSSPGEPDLRCFIDEALVRLPTPFRAAIVSCYLEGLTHEEAAIRLRCPVGTVRSRLARGRALLRACLERSGLDPENRRCEPLALLVVSRVQPFVSSRLMDITSRTAARLAAGEALAAIVPAGLAQLVAGVSSTMTVFRTTLAASLVVLVGVAAWGVRASPADETNVLSPAVSPAAAPQAPLLAFSTSAVSAVSGGSTEPGTDGQRDRPEPAIPNELPPFVLNVEPKIGAKDVDPGLREIRVTFSKVMRDKSWSWTEGTEYSFPKLDGNIHYEYDQRTCVMPVKLEAGKTYVLGINSESFRNFKDLDGRPALPYLLVFHTRADN